MASTRENIELINSNFIKLLNNIHLQEFVPDSLSEFYKMSNEEKYEFYKNKENQLKTGISYDGNQFTLKKDDIEVNFVPFTSDLIEKKDIEVIRNHDFTTSNIIMKVLEIVGSRMLIDARFVFGITDDELKYLVEYKKNKELYIIDIENDFIMKKSDYEKIKNFHEISSIDAVQTFFAGRVCKFLNYCINPLFFVIFYDEVMPYFLNLLEAKDKGYDASGVNYKNYPMLYSGCDTTFKDNIDPNDILNFTDISKITMNPDEYERDESGKLNYKNFKFEVISDMLEESDLKNRLLSYGRYRMCFFDNYMLLVILKKIFINEGNIEYKLEAGDVYYDKERKRPIYHAWGVVKKENKTYVFDFTQNLIMQKDDYYEYALCDVKSEIDIDILIELRNWLIKNAISINYRSMAYLGDYLLQDVKRLEKSLK